MNADFTGDDKLPSLFDALCGCYLERYLRPDFGHLRYLMRYLEGASEKISRYLGRYLNTRTSFSPSCHRENTPREFLERLLGVFTAFVEGRFSRFAFADPFLRGPFEKFCVC